MVGNDLLMHTDSFVPKSFCPQLRWEGFNDIWTSNPYVLDPNKTVSMWYFLLKLSGGEHYPQELLYLSSNEDYITALRCESSEMLIDNLLPGFRCFT